MRELVDKQLMLEDVKSWVAMDSYEQHCINNMLAWIENLPTVEVSDGDCISRRVAIDAVRKNTFRLSFAEEQNCEGHVAWSAEAVYSDVMEGALLELPAAQPELTDEQSIAHLQSSGWMQRHDKEMYESGLKEQLADDSDSYDSLLPTVHPEVIRCGDCKFAHITNEGRYCKYCDMFTDDYGQLIEMYFESNFYCGYAERNINERTGG